MRMRLSGRRRWCLRWLLIVRRRRLPLLVLRMLPVMLMPLLRGLRIRLWLRSSRIGWRPSRRRLLLRVARLRRRVTLRLLLVRSLLLLRLRLSPALRRRWRVSVPTMQGWRGMPRLVLLRLPLVVRRLRRRRRLMLPVVPRARMRLVPLPWWSVLARRRLGMRLMVTPPAQRPLPTRLT